MTDSQAVFEFSVVILATSLHGVFNNGSRSKKQLRCIYFLLFILYFLSFRWAFIII